MDIKTKLRLSKIVVTINNSKKKIKSYNSKISKEKDSKKRQVLKLRKEIEQFRVEMKIREGKIIQLNNN